MTAPMQNGSGYDTPRCRPATARSKIRPRSALSSDKLLKPAVAHHRLLLSDSDNDRTPTNDSFNANDFVFDGVVVDISETKRDSSCETGRPSYDHQRTRPDATSAKSSKTVTLSANQYH